MKLKAPNAFVLIFCIMIAMMILTWIVPGGEYARVEVEIKGVGPQEVVVPNQFKLVPAVKQDHFDLVIAPIKGAEDAAETLAFILLIGGAFGVLTATGALMAGLKWLTVRAKGSGRYVMIIILMFAFSLGGVLFGMAEETLVFVLLTVPLAVSLGFDTITGVAIPFVGSQAGFATAFVNPFSFGIAKQIAQQPSDVGLGYRVMCWLLVTAICIAFVTWHAHRIASGKIKTPTPQLDETWRKKVSDQTSDGEQVISGPQVFTLIVFAASMGLLGYGAIYKGWYVAEISGVFIGMAVICGIAGRLTPNQMADAFMQGARDLCGTAVLVAFSRGIVILAKDAKIIDTILQSVAEGMGGLGPAMGVEVMYVFQSCLNFLIPSGSGQAALTMPIMTPLADLLHIHRESAVLAFQFGDGFTNMIIPTNPVCIGVISAAGLGYGVWFRWMIKWQVLLFFVGAVLLYVAPFTVGE